MPRLRALILASLLLAAHSVLADGTGHDSGSARADGTNHGGGGSELVAQFRELGKLTLDRFEAPQSCGASRPAEAALLRSTLKNVRIVTVDVLTDPVTGLPVKDQEDKVAWGSPGLIQLKKFPKDPTHDSWESLIRRRRPLAKHILHELYRAADIKGEDGLSADDGYQLSMGECHAELWPIRADGEIESYFCYTAFETGRRPVHRIFVPGTDRTVNFVRPMRHKGQDLRSDPVYYSVRLENTARGVRTNVKLMDISSGRSSEVQNVTMVGDRIEVALRGVRPPEAVRGLFPSGTGGDLRLVCEPNYRKPEPAPRTQKDEDAAEAAEASAL